MKSADEHLTFLLERGRRDLPRGDGKQRLLVVLDAAQAADRNAAEPSESALSRLRAPSTIAGVLVRLCLVALLALAASSMKERGPLASGNEGASAVSRVEAPSHGSASSATEGAGLEPDPARPTDEAAPPLLATTPSALPSSAPRPPARKRPLPTARARSSGPATPGASDSLRDELALVDESSRALALGRCDEAEQAIARYRARFPAGRLGDEIDVVAVELLGMRGDRAAAVARAQEFLALHPKSPYATRLSAWLSADPGVAGARRCIQSR